MKYFCKLKVDFNFKAIKNECLELANFTELYASDLSKKNMKALSLISFNGNSYNFRSLPGCNDFLPTWALSTAPAIENLLKKLPGKLFAVRLLELSGRSSLEKHLDYGVGLSYGIIRIHLPIISNEKVIFKIEDESLHLDEGSLWFTDISRYHSVINSSKKTRLHLVIDLCLNQNYERIFPKSFLRQWSALNGNIEYFDKLIQIKKAPLEGAYKMPYLFQPEALKIHKTEVFIFRKLKGELVMTPKGSKDIYKIQMDKEKQIVIPSIGPVIKLCKLQDQWLGKVNVILQKNKDTRSEQTILIPLIKQL